MKTGLKACAAALLTALLVSGCGTDTENSAGPSTTQSRTADAPSADGTGFYAEIGGNRIYYASQGTGRPLILLHGGLISSEPTFGALVPELAKSRRVITVDLQAHGRTPDFDRPMGFESMADDIAGLIGHLGLGQADVLGYSLGGGVALQIATRHPDQVSALGVVSAPYRSDGWLPEMRAGMAAMDAEAMRSTPMYQIYTGVAPDPNGWTALVTKTRQLLVTDYDWTAQLPAVKAPTLVLTAESDALRREHAVDMVARLGKTARLEVIPATTHYDIMSRTDLLTPVLTGFFGGTAGR
ncbi:alpha/beta hydrolase [Nocardia sp. 2]|uniref:Alpha/beta hydrolase n=1 Tax=Nocardia acididurans TaxID=2802282 RepID=A0ABS1M0F6_9NOCA|nr:alpha/beta hydrolase [Nocardia acididurans]MBL1074009.1 alpha/beta hydrolase [Nocardia acididurans]